MVDITSFVVVIIFTLVSATICHLIAKSRGKNPVFWGVMGVIFGPLAIPFIFIPIKRIDNGK